MNKEDREFVKDFIEGTRLLRRALLKDFEMCPICGMKVENMERLANILEALLESPEGEKIG